MADAVSRVRVLAAASPGEVRVAAARGAELLDFAIWRPGGPDGVGDLHRGRIRARVAAMAGAFVALAGSQDGFLPDSEGGREAAEGTVLPVRITRAAQAGKGPRLTARLTPEERDRAGAGPAGLVRRGPGAVERLAARHPEAAVLTDDPALAAALRPALGDRLALRRDLLDEALETAIAELAAPAAALPGGGRITVEPTRALVAIDLDTGAATAGRGGKGAVQRGFNDAAIPVLARQIRLRDLSGAILVDFAGLAARRRAALGPALAAALATDPLQPRLLGFTALGLAEIVRPRVHPPLHELLAGPHAAALAALRAVEAAGQGARLRAAPAVVAALEADPVARADLARRTGRPLMLRSDPTLPGDDWRIETET